MSEDKKKKHTGLKVVGGLLGATAAAYSGFSYVIFRNAFDLKKSAIHKTKHLIHTDEETEAWFSHSQKEDVYLTSYDGLRLHAMMVNNHENSEKWLIVVHGTGSSYKNMLQIMHEADLRELNVLALDQRGCGESEGKYTGLGWNEHYDVISWINWLIRKNHTCKIALYGVNTGGAAVMNACGDYLASNVKCAVEDGSYSGIQEMINHASRTIVNVDAKPFMPAVNLLVQKFLHFSLNDVSFHRQLKQAEIPMLFAHGSDDKTVPASMVFDNYYACASEKELYIVEGKGYGNTSTAPDYWNVVFSFIDKNM